MERIVCKLSPFVLLQKFLDFVIGIGIGIVFNSNSFFESDSIFESDSDFDSQFLCFCLYWSGEDDMAPPSSSSRTTGNTVCKCALP